MKISNEYATYWIADTAHQEISIHVVAIPLSPNQPPRFAGKAYTLTLNDANMKLAENITGCFNTGYRGRSGDYQKSMKYYNAWVAIQEAICDLTRREVSHATDLL